MCFLKIDLSKKFAFECMFEIFDTINHFAEQDNYWKYCN